ncbi:hypothetical protein [Plebeiibacterium sediminum]|uniref:Uncharacterized protein n=1 Tax=Plebeiibacterium sediminum TaxID=2992112 RepID=A0AAE3M147_9BACT|nr:hypothetical protein [Plebeiobacterium sediminum]MCW3784941.1 hypothetical protein [Plebeiobacterium sediminum]
MALQFVKNFFNKIDPQDMFKTVASGVDKAFFTNEERSDINKEIYYAQLEFAKTESNANTISSKARRSLAFMVAIPFMLFKSIASGLAMFGYTSQANQVDTINNGIAIYFGGIMTYYFGIYLYQQHTKNQAVKRLRKVSDKIEAKQQSETND